MVPKDSFCGSPSVPCWGSLNWSWRRKRKKKSRKRGWRQQRLQRRQGRRSWQTASPKAKGGKMRRGGPRGGRKWEEEGGRAVSSVKGGREEKEPPRKTLLRLHEVSGFTEGSAGCRHVRACVCVDTHIHTEHKKDKANCVCGRCVYACAHRTNNWSLDAPHRLHAEHTTALIFSAECPIKQAKQTHTCMHTHTHAGHISFKSF